MDWAGQCFLGNNSEIWQPGDSPGGVVMCCGRLAALPAFNAGHMCEAYYTDTLRQARSS